jgi:hypothetical protein
MFVDMPRLILSIDDLLAAATPDASVPKELSQQATSILLKNIKLQDAAAQLRQAYTRSLSANHDGSLERELSTAFETSMRAIHKISISGHRVRASILEGKHSSPIAIAAGDVKDEKKLIMAAWKAMGDNLSVS